MEECCLLACSSGLCSACFFTPPKDDVDLEMLGIRQRWGAYLNHSSVKDCIACSLGYCAHGASADIFL